MQFNFKICILMQETLKYVKICKLKFVAQQLFYAHSKNMQIHELPGPNYDHIYSKLNKLLLLILAQKTQIVK